MEWNAVQGARDAPATGGHAGVRDDGVIEIEAIGPAGRRDREQLPKRFRALFAEVPGIMNSIVESII
ncbi:hypothetical protein ACWCXH_13160 [Kitasatospora sp. NPDC001660]